MTGEVPRGPIVHVVQRMAPGGIETLVLDLVASGSGDERVVSLDGTTADLVTEWPALAPISSRIDAFQAGAGLKPELIFKLVRHFKELCPSVVFLHHVGPYLYGGIAARLAGVDRVVHVEHDVWHYGLARRRSIARALEVLVRPHHVAVSRHVAGVVRDVSRSADVSVIHNGIDLDRFIAGDRDEARRQFGLPLDVKIVGSIGRLVEVKGHAELIRTAAMLGDDCHVAIVGDGPERQRLAQLAAASCVDRRVHFVGHIDGVERVLPAFDVFCLPSYSEGFPRSIVEAQAAGVPVVATDVGGVGEAVCPHTGHLVAPRDPTALAIAIQKVLSRGPAVSPRDHVAARFDWPSALASYKKAAEVAHAA